ncbi:MAG TPA: xanthan lyase, partial [Bacteroides reticulotermitis]|nr:xanthan lyase [Bacteroides reticulotermitis]
MKKIVTLFLFFLAISHSFYAQDIERNIKERLTDYFSNYKPTAKINAPKLKDINVDYDRRVITINATESFTYQPFLPETVDAVYDQIKALLPGPVNFFNLTICADGKPIEDLIPNIYRKKKKDKERLSLHIDYKGNPWVKNVSRGNEIS